MKIDFKGLAEGFSNKHFSSGELRQVVKEVSEERLTICRGCEFNSKNQPQLKTPGRHDEHCLSCGCNLAYKTACLSCRCPLPEPKWDALTSSEVNTEIQGKIIENAKGE